jgi:hypothetical protein
MAFTILQNRTELAGSGGSIISPIPLRINVVTSLDVSSGCQESTKRLIPSASILCCTLGVELMGTTSTLDDPFDPFGTGLSRRTPTTYGLDMYFFSSPTSFYSQNPLGMELRSNDLPYGADNSHLGYRRHSDVTTRFDENGLRSLLCPSPERPPRGIHPSGMAYPSREWSSSSC